MINKKLLFLSFLMFSVFLAVCVYADRNIVTTLNGSNFISDSGKKTNSYSFIGQPVVFATKEEKEVTSQSAFASLFYITQNSSITFTNNTGEEPFDDISVDLKVRIESKVGVITKIRYRIWQGKDPDWNNYSASPEIELSSTTDFDPGETVDLVKKVNFPDGEEINYFKIYAQVGEANDTNTYPKRWSEAYMVRISSGLASGIEIISPDRISGTATIDPQVETTAYSLNLTTATITLTNEDKGSEIYTVNLSSSTNEDFKMYSDGRIYYLHSEFITNYNKIKGSSIPTTLDNNTTYKLSITANNKTDSVIFKALSGGVADILTYPSPFNPNKEKIKIRYLLAKTSNVTIRLYDKAGKVVCKLIDGEERSAGTNEEEWDGRNYAGETLATGAYIVEIIAGSDRRYTALAIVGK